MEKIYVKLKSNGQYNDYKAGQIGFIHGYLRGGDDRPYAVVVVGKDVVMAILYDLEVIENPELLNSPS